MLPHDDVLSFIASESNAFAATIAPDALDRQVPGCPDWTLWWLVGHLGNVQRFWARTVRAGGEPAGDPPDLDVHDAPEVAAWCRAATRELLDALRETSWDAPAWTWWGEPRTVGAIARHQAQEAAVHRWDAESAVGTASPIPSALADDAVDEFLDILRGLDVADSLPGAVDLRATDTASLWTIGPGDPGVTVRAPASDLLLFLYGRLPDDAVAIDGRRALVDALLEAAATG